MENLVKNLLPKMTVSVIVLLLLFVGCSKKGETSSSKGANNAKVLYVVDGDTYAVSYNGKNERIRLIGIDTPEKKANAKAHRDAERSEKDVDEIVKLGREASDFVKTLIKPADEVRLEFDMRERDKYGRLLVYLYLPDGRMLNEVIIRSGYASVMTYAPNVKYVDLFTEAYKEARENNRGLWKK